MKIKTKVLLGIIFCSVAILYSASLDINIVGATTTKNDQSDNRIIIDQNSDILSYSTSGDGSSENPYIIKNYEIVTSSQTAVSIKNTNSYLVLRNLNVKTSNYGTGILIEKSSNLVIESCFISENDNGLTIYDSTVEILNNTFYNNSFAFNSWGGPNQANIEFNEFSENRVGISITGSSSSYKIYNNIFLSNEESGIFFDLYSKIEIKNNSFTYSGMLVPYAWIPTSDVVVTNNSLNGKPILYVSNAFNQTFDTEIGQLILVGGTKNTVRNLTFSNTATPINIVGSFQTTIENNIISNAVKGLYLVGNSNMSVRNNSITQSRTGMFIEELINGEFMDNSLSFNQDGIYLHETSKSIFSRNLFNNHTNSAIYIYIYQISSYFGTINNTFYLNSFYNSIVKGDAYSENSDSKYNILGAADNDFSNGTVGNFWSFFTAVSDSDRDLVSDFGFQTSYILDPYPLMTDHITYLEIAPTRTFPVSSVIITLEDPLTSTISTSTPVFITFPPINQQPSTSQANSIFIPSNGQQTLLFPLLILTILTGIGSYLFIEYRNYNASGAKRKFIPFFDFIVYQNKDRFDKLKSRINTIPSDDRNPGPQSNNDSIHDTSVYNTHSDSNHIILASGKEIIDKDSYLANGFCPFCKEKIELEDFFCQNCGNQLGLR